MKRPRSPDALPVDPVLAQLDALINGGTSEEIVVAPAALPAANPVLAQLDALINPGAAQAAPTVALPLLPSPSAPPLLRPQEPQQQAEEPLLPLNHPAWRHAGLLREFGGVKAWMRSLRSSDAEAEP